MRTARARVSSSNFPSAPMAPVSLLDRSLSHTQGDSKARRAALQMLRAQIISAPEELRDQVRNLTRMQLIRTCAAWRPDVSDAADAVTATRIALKSLARRILDLGDEISMLDELITPLVTDLAPRLLERPGIGIEIAGQLLVTAGDNPQRCAASPRSRCSAASRRCPPRPGRPDGTGSTTRRPAGQRPAPRRHQPPADGPADEGLRRETHRARAQQAEDDSVPQALPRPRGLLPAQPRPAPNGREKDQNCGLTNRRASAGRNSSGPKYQDRVGSGRTKITLVGKGPALPSSCCPSRSGSRSRMLAEEYPALERHLPQQQVYATNRSIVDESSARAAVTEVTTE